MVIFSNTFGTSRRTCFNLARINSYCDVCNKCIFCFIDQLPKGMRDTLYFKDDDSRLSFLQGNYVTLTNMSDEDVQRIITYRMEPINISFQAMHPELRCQMLHNRFAGDALKKVDRFYEAGIVMNGQIVLCKGVNDGKELEYSIEQLVKYLPYLQSVSVVPVGLTRYRDGLYPLEPFTKEDACAVLALIHSWQDRLYKEYGSHFIHAGDEWYLLAEEEIPTEDSYDGYMQLENGVGMIRLLQEEVREELAALAGDDCERRVTIATGELAAPILEELGQEIKAKYPKLDLQVKAVKNEFFGGKITVAGLLTGQDLKKQLADLNLGEELLLTEHMMKSGEQVFLDDVTVEELSGALQVPITIVKSDGKSFLDAVLGRSEN